MYGIDKNNYTFDKNWNYLNMNKIYGKRNLIL